MTDKKISLPEIKTEQKSGAEKFLMNGIEKLYAGIKEVFLLNPFSKFACCRCACN